MPPPPSLAVRPCVVKERRQHGACGVRTACWPKHVVNGCVIKTETHETFGHVFLPAEYMADPAAAAASVHFETRSDERVKVDFESENNLSPPAAAATGCLG